MTSGLLFPGMNPGNIVLFIYIFPLSLPLTLCIICKNREFILTL